MLNILTGAHTIKTPFFYTSSALYFSFMCYFWCIKMCSGVLMFLFVLFEYSSIRHLPSKSTSPIRRSLPVTGSWTRLMPTSITTAPSFTISAVIKRGTPVFIQMNNPNFWEIHSLFNTVHVLTKIVQNIFSKWIRCCV